MGMEPEKTSKCLYSDNRTGYHLLIPPGGCIKYFKHLPTTPAEIGKQFTVIKKVPSQNFWDAEHYIPMRNLFYNFPAQPIAEFHHLLLMT